MFVLSFIAVFNKARKLIFILGDGISVFLLRASQTGNDINIWFFESGFLDVLDSLRLALTVKAIVKFSFRLEHPLWGGFFLIWDFRPDKFIHKLDPKTIKAWNRVI